ALDVPFLGIRVRGRYLVHSLRQLLHVHVLAELGTHGRALARRDRRRRLLDRALLGVGESVPVLGELADAETRIGRLHARVLGSRPVDRVLAHRTVGGIRGTAVAEDAAIDPT